MNAGETKADTVQPVQPVPPEPKGGLSKKALLAFAAIPLGGAFGVKVYLSVYNILWIVLVGHNNSSYNGCWAGRMCLAAYALTVPFVFIISGLVQSVVAKKFGAEPRAVVALPLFVVTWFQSLKLPRKALAITMMSWPLAILGFFIFWITLMFLSLSAHGAFSEHHPGDCLHRNDFLAQLLYLHASTALYTLLLALLPIWPGPSFMAFSLLISKFGVSKRATVLRMGAVSIGICLAVILVEYCVNGVEILLGQVDAFTLLLIINVLVMGYRFLSDADGESWAPFPNLVEELADSGAEVGYAPLLNPSPAQSL